MSARWTEQDYASHLAKKAIKRAGGRAGEARTEIKIVPDKQYKLVIIGKAEPGGSKQAFVPLHPTKICECGPIPGKLPYRREGGGIMVSVTDANKHTKAWQAHVAKIAREEYGGPCFSQAVAVQFIFYRQRPDGHYGTKGLNKQGRENPFPGTKPDTTKLVRAAEDALTGICWQDDALIVRQTAWKEYGEPARLEISIEALAVETGQSSLLEAAEPLPPWETQ